MGVRCCSYVQMRSPMLRDGVGVWGWGVVEGGTAGKACLWLAAETWGGVLLPAHQLWTVREVSLVVS